MKFSFESQQYRDEVVNELEKTEKSERKALLEKKKKTLKFVLAEHIRDFNRKNDKKIKETPTEIEREDQEDIIERKKIVGEIIPWIDREGERFEVEVEIIDISDQIPESVQIIYDMNRLLEVESSYKDKDVSRGWYKKDLLDHEVFATPTGYINRDIEDPIDVIVKKYVQMAKAERGESLTKDDGTIIDEEELEKIAEQAKKDFIEFREKMTEGLVNNPNVFYHTIGAYTTGFTQDWYRSTIISEADVKEKLRNRFPNDDGDRVEETPLEINEDLISDGLYVHSGEIIYDNLLKPLMLIDGASPRFEKQIREYAQSSTEFKSLDTLDEALEDANTKASGRGANWGIKLISKDYRGVHWLGVADQIFDPYHGRMIKIKALDIVSEDSVKNESQALTLEAQSEAKEIGLFNLPESGEEKRSYVEKIRNWAKKNNILGNVEVRGIGVFELSLDDPYNEGEDLWISPYWSSQSDTAYSDHIDHILKED